MPYNRVGLCLDMLVNELLQGHGPGFGVAAVTGILDIALHAGRAQALACSRSLKVLEKGLMP